MANVIVGGAGTAGPAESGGQVMTQSRAQDWRQWLRRKIAWLLLVKLIGLLVLRSLFFSGEQRHSVDETGLAQRLAVEQAGK
jgi:hypothetical protein